MKLVMRLAHVTMPHHTWGRSEDGHTAVKVVMKALCEKHEAEHGPDVPFHTVQVDHRNHTCAKLFKKLPPMEQEFWRGVAKEDAQSR